MHKAELLDQVTADILKNNICPDLAKTATNLVMGDGNPDAQIVFIGEAPGKKEDEQGLPFVGAAGMFLNDMLASIDQQRSDIYITNIVKYRPPKNRDPSPQEKKAFWPYLIRQLMIIEPKIIVTLGRHSMEYFLPKAKISLIHGQLQRVSATIPESKAQAQWHLLPLYHPAAALYNGKLRATLSNDFTQLPNIITQL